MPTFRYTDVLAANGVGDPLRDWQYRYLPYAANVEHLSDATTVDVVKTITSGSETIVEESPVQAAGVAGVTPSPLNTSADSWIGAAGDLVKIRNRETGGAAATVNGVINVNPA